MKLVRFEDYYRVAVIACGRCHNVCILEINSFGVKR